MSETTETTNATTADLATQRDVIPLRSLQLIGVVGPEEDRRALLRSSGGQIDTVRVGDALRQGTVVAIDDDAVILNAATGSRTLRIPQSTALPRVAA
ncbi:pilus assembly protein PilP [Tateyamaria armeniaca]|uniref:Pilus assembly protein PilP n=1 Tax=Tateyamaria armeniaca TaxID=2518930 RepID=A0ABW8UVW5_9RHOB